MIIASPNDNQPTMNTLKNLITLAAFTPLALSAQERYMTRTGNVSFFSETPMENISAVNHKATSVLDATTGAIEFAVLVKAFEFDRALMQEHFNENYMESGTFPKATFKGKVVGLAAGALQKPGSYNVTVEGTLTMHGVEKKITMPAVFTVSPAGAVAATCEFKVKCEDYNIKVPGTVRANIAEEIVVKVQVDYTKM
jgi:polyisoprenoid-binding protein YceI